MKSLNAVIWLVLAALASAQQELRMPMPVEFENSAEYAWLNKRVLDARVLDDMADPARWSFQGQGHVRFLGEDEGSRRAAIEVNLHDPAAPTGWSGTPAVALRRNLPGEDWSRYNRLSFRVRPVMSGFNVLTLTVAMTNDGKEKVPDVYRREGGHYVTLANNRWTDVTWEIPNVARDKVTSLEFQYWVPKRLPASGDRVSFEIGPVKLERVDADHYEGWNVGPGTIAFSHTGYQTGASKTAVASGLAAGQFTVMDADTGATVLRKPLRTVKTRLGEFQQLDFSELRQAGRYTLSAGGLRSRPFRVDSNVWDGTIRKTLNFFFGERCGMEIPGIHEACHRDWQAVLGDKKIVMNGGWHDAGDLSQGLINTAETVYAMFALAARMQARGEDPALVKRLLEEARWGLDWVLKVRFEGGYRIGFASLNLWTNGVIGDADDRTREALNNPNVNYLAASAEAIAYNVLRDTEPELAARCLRTAEEDWGYAIAGKEIPETQHTPAFAATEMELASVGILASMELFKATGGARYAEKARELAKVVVNSQQRSYVGRDFPVAGFFHNSPAKQDIFQQFHRGNDQAPIVAMARLCEAFPDDDDWMKWYSVVALYSEYQKKTAETTQPYGVLPAYVYKDDEYLKAVDGDRYQSSREAYRQQVLKGMPLGDGYYLKAFPVWFGRRGNYGVLLSQAKGLSTAARLRRDLAAAGLAERQLEWVLGRNPFAQSTMWGEGYGFAQQYSVSSGDIVGSLPVGMMTRGNEDVPYWPAQNSYVYKEVWVHPSARWLWIMEDLAGPALVEGGVGPGGAGDVAFTDVLTGQGTRVNADPARGTFRAFLPAGRYRVAAGGRETTATFLPGGSYGLDLRPSAAVDFQLEQSVSAGGRVTIRVIARGAGRHTFEIRTDRLKVGQRRQELVLAPGESGILTWEGTAEAADAPWVAVVFADDDISARKDLVGRAGR